VAGIGPNTSVWRPGTGPLPAQLGRGIGRPPKLLRRDQQHQPISVKAFALSLPAQTWQNITWREGTADWLSSRFARQRVRPAHRDTLLTEPRAEEWLLIEWPQGEAEPTKYWFATLPEDIAFERLVDFAKLRWRIERDYQELKQELARLPPPCHPLYCRLRLFDRRTRRHSPLRTLRTGFLRAALGIYHSRGLPTQRRRRSDPNGTSPTRSQQSKGASSSRSQDPSEMPLLQCPPGRRQEFRLLTQ
jgi:DDE superfamily endonuclease